MPSLEFYMEHAGELMEEFVREGAKVLYAGHATPSEFEVVRFCDNLTIRRRDSFPSCARIARPNCSQSIKDAETSITGFTNVPSLWFVLC